MSFAYEASYPESRLGAVAPSTPDLAVTSADEEISHGDHLTLVEPTIVGHQTSAISSPELVQAARELTAQKYLRRGFVQPEQVVDGVIANDPYHAHSTYYADRNDLSDGSSQIVVTARKIHYEPSQGEDSFPVWQRKDEFYPDAVTRIEETGLENCVELSALVKDSQLDTDGIAPLRLYRTIFQDALGQIADGRKEETYLMAANPVLFETFKANFNGYIERIGPDMDYPGQEAVPAMIRPRSGIIDALHRLADDDIDNDQLKFVIGFMLEGLDESRIDDEVAEAIRRAREVGAIPPAVPSPQLVAENASVIDDETVDDGTEKRGLLQGLKEHLRRRKPEYIAGTALVGYTALRTFGVADQISPTTDVDWRIFLGVELATTPTYVKGMGDLARSAADPESYSRKQQVGAVALAGGSFLAPYAYVLAEGEGMPKSSLVGVAALLGVSAISALRRLRGARKSAATEETPA